MEIMMVSLDAAANGPQLECGDSEHWQSAGRQGDSCRYTDGPVTDRWGKHAGTKAAFDVTVSIVEPNSNSHSPNEVAALATGISHSSSSM